MLKTTLSLLVLLAASMPAFAAEPTLLFGCQVLPRGGGVEVVFAESSAPIPLPDGSLEANNVPMKVDLLVQDPLGGPVEFELELPDSAYVEARVRIDTPQEFEYYRNGGILHYVLRQLAA